MRSYGKWVQCPDCEGREIVSLETDDDPPMGLVMDEFECLSCGKTWEQAGVELPNGNTLEIWRVP